MNSIEKNILEAFKAISKNKNILNEFIEPTSTITMISPVPIPKNFRSNFGKYFGSGEDHPGVDIPAVSGTPVKAPMDGKIKDAHYYENPICGGTVDIEYGNNLWSRFCHLKRIDVKKGDLVKQGQIVGLSGGAKTDPHHGRTDGPHLHWAFLDGNKRLNPIDYLNKSADIMAKLATKSDITQSDFTQSDMTKSPEIEKTTETDFLKDISFPQLIGLLPKAIFKEEIKRIKNLIK